MKQTLTCIAILCCTLLASGQTFTLIDKDVQVGQVNIPKNIFFNFNSCELRDESNAALDSIYDFLKLNETVTLEVAAHWDNKHPEMYREMSQHFTVCRAENVVKYLVEKGIKKKRLTAAGRENSEPLFSDEYIENLESEEAQNLAHDRNRRVELTVIEKGY